MPCHFCLVRTAADGCCFSLPPANPSIVCNSRVMSRQDQEETELPSFTEAQQAWIERLIATKISEAAPTSTATTTSDTTVSSGASVGATSSGTTVTAATTAVHGGIGEYSVKMGGGVKGEKHNKMGPEMEGGKLHCV